jgi:hypothetical protein
MSWDDDLEGLTRGELFLIQQAQEDRMIRASKEGITDEDEAERESWAERNGHNQ